MGRHRQRKSFIWEIKRERSKKSAHGQVLVNDDQAAPGSELPSSGPAPPESIASTSPRAARDSAKSSAKSPVVIRSRIARPSGVMRGSPARRCRRKSSRSCWPLVTAPLWRVETTTATLMAPMWHIRRPDQHHVLAVVDNPRGPAPLLCVHRSPEGELDGAPHERRWGGTQFVGQGGKCFGLAGMNADVSANRSAAFLVVTQRG